MKKSNFVLVFMYFLFGSLQGSGLSISTDFDDESTVGSLDRDMSVSFFTEKERKNEYVDEWPDLNFLKMMRAASIFNPFSKTPIFLENSQFNLDHLQLVVNFLEEAKKVKERCADASLLGNKSLKTCRLISSECEKNLLKINRYVDKIYAFLNRDDNVDSCEKLNQDNDEFFISQTTYLKIIKFCEDLKTPTQITLQDEPLTIKYAFDCCGHQNESAPNNFLVVNLLYTY